MLCNSFFIFSATGHQRRCLVIQPSYLVRLNPISITPRIQLMLKCWFYFVSRRTQINKFKPWQQTCAEGSEQASSVAWQSSCWLQPWSNGGGWRESSWCEDPKECTSWTCRRDGVVHAESGWWQSRRERQPCGWHHYCYIQVRHHLIIRLKTQCLKTYIFWRRAPPVIFWTRREASSCLRSSSCLVSSALFLLRSSWALTAT